ncbi:MAG TPA: AraC family transcriptional regulator [Verrucomicrobiales bacterium]|nr:AraC family transcriptional regulator [Verrucomicrobiales bacterium]
MPRSAPSDPAESFFASLGEWRQLLQLFDHLPRVYLFMKDRQGRFMKANRSELALHGLKTEAEMIGRTDYDFHPPAMAAQYVEEDVRVMKSGRPLCDQVWLVMGHDKLPRWYLCTKIPLRDRQGRSMGIAGVMRPFDHSGPSPSQYGRLTPVMEHVLAHYGQRIEASDLAKLAHLSVSQFQREFRRLFSMSAGDYLLKVRLLMARRRLEEGGDPVGQIALDCGFYDQSHFNRAFRAQMGMPPLDYRRRFQR